MASVQDVRVPDIGDFADVQIIEILVGPGDRIEPEQSLLTLESDKATMEIPSPIGGAVKEVKVAVGDKVNLGDLLLTVETAGENESAPETPPSTDDVADAPPAAEAPPPNESAASRTETIEVRLPDIGDFTDVPVIEILVAPGEHIAADQSLLTLESDKATMEIPSSQAGTLRSLEVAVGDKLNRGDLIAVLEATGAAPAGSEATPAPSEPAADTKPAPSQRTDTRQPGDKERRQAPVLPRPEDMATIARGRKPHASPAVRRFARELGVDLARVKGSGRKGRILKEDVQDFVKDALARGASPEAALPFALPSAPDIDYAKFGPVELTELPRIKRISGKHLHRSWLSVPHVTQFDEADITELEAFRKSQKAAAEAAGVKLTLLPILLKVVAVALARMPNLKSSLTGDGERLILKHFTHIGVAVDTPHGLVVPVVRDVDQKGLFELAGELIALSAKARDGKLLPGDMQGGCFSISSLGGIGGTGFTPIINAPEAAILGVSRAEPKPWWNGSEFVPRLKLPFSLSYDHRIVDGAEGVRFTSLLAELLGDIRKILL